MILPAGFWASVGRNSISFGAMAAPSRLRASHQVPAQLVTRLKAGLERDERFDDLHGDRIGFADHAGLRDGRMFHQAALHLERTDQVAGGLDDVVFATDEPKVAVGVAFRQVAGQVPAVAKTLR